MKAFKVLYIVILLLGSASALASYNERLQSGIAECEAIPAFESHSGMWLNPEGYGAYWGRSACYQKVATEFRDISLCDRVYRNYSLFSSSWGYSRENCRVLVAGVQREDVAELQKLKAAYNTGPVVLVDVLLQKNGNGRDVDVIPEFSAGHAGSYILTLFLVDDAAKKFEITSNSFYLGDGKSDINWYIPRETILAAMPHFDDSAEYAVVINIEFSLPLGRANGVWPETWPEQIWPVKERRQRFSAKKMIQPWVPVKY